MSIFPSVLDAQDGSGNLQRQDQDPTKTSVPRYEVKQKVAGASAETKNVDLIDVIPFKPSGASGSTSSYDLATQQILRMVHSLFQAAAHEDFEFGTESPFIKSLDTCVTQYGTKGVLAIASIILNARAKPRVIAEALRWLGNLTHQPSYLLRLRTLEVCLGSPSRWVRDGASLGLEAMNDPRAIPYLREAVNREQLPELRKDLEAVLRELERGS